MFLFLVLCFLFVKLFTVFILLSLLSIYIIVTLNLIEQIAYLHFVQFFWDFNVLLCLNIFSVSFFCLIPVWPAVYWPQKSLGWCPSTGWYQPQVLVCQREESRMALRSAVVFLVERAIKILHQCLSPGRVPVVSCLSQEACQDQQAGLTQVSFHISACVLGLRVCETLHSPLESGVSVPIALQLSCVQVPLAFQASHPGGSFSQHRTPGWEVQCGPQTPQALRRTSLWIPLSF